MISLPSPFTPVEDHCLRLFLEWFNERYSAHLEPPSVEPAPGEAEETGPPDFSPPLFICTDSGNGKRLAVIVRTLYEEGEPWHSYRRQLEEQLSADLKGSYILWVPPGADLPADGLAVASLLTRVRQVAATLSPGQRTDVTFPVSLRLVKLREEGAYISVEGGLSYMWSRLSEGAAGSFFLNTQPVHRIPASEEYEEELMQAIAAAARELSVGQSTEVASIDAWALRRLHSGSGVAIVGGPRRVTDDEEATVVRRTLRRVALEASNRFAQSSDTTQDRPRSDLHALLVIGSYVHMEQEGVSTALLGFDPSVYANIEMLALAADAQIKPILPPRMMLWQSTT